MEYPNHGKSYTTLEIAYIQSVYEVTPVDELDEKVEELAKQFGRDPKSLTKYISSKMGLRKRTGKKTKRYSGTKRYVGYVSRHNPPIPEHLREFPPFVKGERYKIIVANTGGERPLPGEPVNPGVRNKYRKLVATFAFETKHLLFFRLQAGFLEAFQKTEPIEYLKIDKA